LDYLIWAWKSGKIRSDRIRHAVLPRLWEVEYWNGHMMDENWLQVF
jgi:hypothetical protein